MLAKNWAVLQAPNAASPMSHRGIDLKAKLASQKADMACALAIAAAESASAAAAESEFWNTMARASRGRQPCGPPDATSAEDATAINYNAAAAAAPDAASSPRPTGMRGNDILNSQLKVLVRSPTLRGMSNFSESREASDVLAPAQPERWGAQAQHDDGSEEDELMSCGQ